ncbi:MAG: GAF domain-containing sensor histidine kinase, partial [Candidatus Limnocylindria bacterium]
RYAVAVTDAATRASSRLPAVLAALDEAVRGISGVLELDRVLQLIVDRVRELLHARYAALGIMDDQGRITDFLTSGITADERRAIGDLPRGHGLLGLIIRENRSYRIADIASHPERHGFPPNHPPMRSFLGVPIPARGAVAGRLYLTDKTGAAEFSEQDQALAEMFALHAGIAIENASLHEQVQRLAVFDERDRISRELHDSVIQSIYAVTLLLDDVPEMARDGSAEAAARVDEAIEALQVVIRDIRNFIFGLRPILLDTGLLADGLRTLADQLRRGSSVHIQVRGDEPAGIPIEVITELLAIAREALANVARHSTAAHAWVDVRDAGATLRLEVGDDGIGLHDAAAGLGGHHGLANMRARAETLGGSFETRSEPGSGTRIIVQVPRTGRSR